MDQPGDRLRASARRRAGSDRLARPGTHCGRARTGRSILAGPAAPAEHAHRRGARLHRLLAASRSTTSDHEHPLRAPGTGTGHRPRNPDLPHRGRGGAARRGDRAREHEAPVAELSGGRPAARRAGARRRLDVSAGWRAGHSRRPARRSPSPWRQHPDRRACARSGGSGLGRPGPRRPAVPQQLAPVGADAPRRPPGVYAGAARVPLRSGSGEGRLRPRRTGAVDERRCSEIADRAHRRHSRGGVGERERRCPWARERPAVRAGRAAVHPRLDPRARGERRLLGVHPRSAQLRARPD